MTVRIQQRPFDLGEEIRTFTGARTDAGAIVTFTGLVRDLPDAQLHEMVIEHYPGMTEKSVAAMVDQATLRWNLIDALVIHRHGPLVPGDAIMMVATAAPHRADAFAAAEYLMDYLKSRAPFWKKEVTQTGAAWVDSKPEDEDALSRWSTE